MNNKAVQEVGELNSTLTIEKIKTIGLLERITDRYSSKENILWEGGSRNRQND